MSGGAASRRRSLQRSLAKHRELITTHNHFVSFVPLWFINVVRQFVIRARVSRAAAPHCNLQKPKGKLVARQKVIHGP